MVIGREETVAICHHPHGIFRVIIELHGGEIRKELEPLPRDVRSSVEPHASLRATLRAIGLESDDILAQQAEKLGGIVKEKLRFPHTGRLHAIHLPAPRREKARSGAGDGTVRAHFPAPRNLRGGEIQNRGQVVRAVALAGLRVSIERKQLKFHQGKE